MICGVKGVPLVSDGKFSDISTCVKALFQTLKDQSYISASFCAIGRMPSDG